jgi:steroid delta-isomerase-like uncharacterized protein
MSVEENIALMRRWFNEVWNQGRLDAIAEMMAPDAVGVGAAGPDQVIHGPAEFRLFAEQFQKAFSRIQITVEDAFGSDDKVAVRWSAEMTHTGEGIGIPATGRTARVRGISLARVENGKLVEGWDNWDQLGLQQQLQASTAAG